MKNSTTRTRWIVGSAASVALLLASGLAVGSAALAQTASQEVPLLDVLETSESPDATERLSALIPLDNIGGGGIDGAITTLAETTKGSFWAARDKEGNYCLISNPAGTDLFSASCAPEESFAENGVWVSSESGPLSKKEVYLEAYLVPDAVAESLSARSLRESGLTQITANLIIGDSRAPELSGESLLGSADFSVSAFTD